MGCRYLPPGQGGQGGLADPHCPGDRANPVMETATSERGWHAALAQPGPQLPPWEDMWQQDQLALLGLDGCWWGGCKCSPGCWNQVPPDRPAKTAPASVPPPRPTGHCGHGHIPVPATGLFPRAEWIREVGQPKMSLPPAPYIMKRGPPSSPQICQGTIFLCQVRHGNADANAIPWSQLGPGLPVGQYCPAGDKGTLFCDSACWWHRTGRGQWGSVVPALPPHPGSLGGCPPWLTSPLHDSPLYVSWSGSLPEVLGVLGLPGCPEGRKTWGHCRDGFSPVGVWGVSWERRPRQYQQLW